MDISAHAYGLKSNIKLELLSENHIGIVKLIKSRIIRKDAQKIIEIARKILDKNAKVRISLICNPNICSKSIQLLNENGIEVIQKNPEN